MGGGMEDFVGSNGFQGERKRNSSSPTKDKQTKDKLYRDKKKNCPPNKEARSISG